MQEIVGSLAVAFMCLGGVASANIIYNVDITDGTTSVTGTITTDGASGPLAVGDIKAWVLKATGPLAFAVNSAFSFLRFA